MKPTAFLGALFSASLATLPVLAAPVSSLTQYGVTWTFDGEYESGRFATGDYWVVGPVTVVSVSPAPTGTRNGSCVNPLGGRQGYDDRGGEFATDDQVAFPHTFLPDESLVSSVSKAEGVETQNAGNMVAQAVLTVVSGPLPEGTLRPAYAGTYKRYFDVSQVQWDLLPSLPVPSSAPDGQLLLAEADRPRLDHLSSWTIQHSCAEENWNNGPGAHACYGREVSTFVSEAALYVLLDTPERDELVLSMVQHGIDNYGVLRAGGNWAPNGGHHSGRKWPIVFAATLLDDCDMKAVGTDYDDTYFGEDGQTYIGVEGAALFGWDCGGGQGSYFENGCTGSGAKDCRDPALTVDGCPDYRLCCTSGYWVGQMLSTVMLGAQSVWNHDAYFDYVDRWMSGTDPDADGSDAFSEAMWTLYRDSWTATPVSPSCGPGAGGTGAGGTGVGGTGVGGTGAGTGGAGPGGVSAGGTSPGTSGNPASGGGASDGDDSGGCGCQLPRTGSSSGRALGLVALALVAARWRRRRAPRGGAACTRA